MEIRKPCNLANMYLHKTHHSIEGDSPELRFMECVCLGDTENALRYFNEKKLLSDVPVAVDTPYGRFEGLDRIREFADGFNKKFNADISFITPVVQTIANGRVALEAVINFIVDGAIEQVPMFIIGDFRTAHQLDEIRIYCHFSFVPGLQAYRKPIFTPAHLEMGDPQLLTGAVRIYYEALHHMPVADTDKIYECCTPDCRFGGMERWGRAPADAGDVEKLREKIDGLRGHIPFGVGMRYETIIDDGKTCVIEWVHIVSRKGREQFNRISLSGIAAYERAEDGRLCSIRISDYAKCEHTIEWDKVGITKEEAQEINFVEVFPEGVGAKPQY